MCRTYRPGATVEAAGASVYAHSTSPFRVRWQTPLNPLVLSGPNKQRDFNARETSDFDHLAVAVRNVRPRAGAGVSPSRRNGQCKACRGVARVGEAGTRDLSQREQGRLPE